MIWLHVHFLKFYRELSSLMSGLYILYANIFLRVGLEGMMYLYLFKVMTLAVT